MKNPHNREALIGTFSALAFVLALMFLAKTFTDPRRPSAPCGAFEVPGPPVRGGPMSISHWGVFPGWWEQKPEADGSFKISGAIGHFWRVVDFDLFCSVVYWRAECVMPTAGARNG